MARCCANASSSIRPLTQPLSIAATAPPRSSISAISRRASPSMRVGQPLDVLRAAERVGDGRDTGLVQQHLLRAQRERRRALGRQRERLVVAVRVQRLAAARRRGERLQRDAHDVVQRALGGQRRAAGLGVEAQRERALVARAEALAHERGPDPACRAELRDLREDVVVGVEEERETRREDVDLEAGGDRRLDVGDAVGEREPELLRRARAGLADVVAGDRDRVEARQPLVAVAEEVDRQAHRRARREDVVAARGVLLEHVVLHRAAQLAPAGRRARRRPARRAAGGRPPGALIVIDVETSPSGMPSNSRSMSSSESIATPVRPTSPRASGSSESRPSCVGRSKATERPVCPRSSSRRKRSLVSSADAKPAYWRIVQGRVA